VVTLGSAASVVPAIAILLPRIPLPITSQSVAATASSIRIGQPSGRPMGCDPAVLHPGLRYRVVHAGKRDLADV
jgi:hypothetical protein